VRRPDAEAIRLPLALLDEPLQELRRAAQLGSGALARAGREEHPEAAAAVERELASRHAAARDPGERLALLAALGNAAGPAAVEVLARALGDPSPEVRAAGARGLRLASGQDVDTLLAAAMASDADARVRLAAIFSAGFRSFEPFAEALCAAATGDRAEEVRGAAVGLLRRQLDASPCVRPALARVAARDPSPGLRRLAGEPVPAARR
jgi:HEAT repeat protein